ncbi:MAG: hypothetical protein H7Y60_12360 [Rhodospirillaceae bacterium]|nr:hypothetical protein [Rhodospirillales bacterium]
MPPTIRTTTTHDADPLGVDGRLPVLERLRQIAEDAVAGRNEEAVHSEAVVLRARLKPVLIPAGPGRIVCAIEDLPPEFVQALLQPLPDDHEAKALDHLLDADPGEWSLEAERLLGEEDEPEAPAP